MPEGDFWFSTQEEAAYSSNSFPLEWKDALLP